MEKRRNFETFAGELEKNHLFVGGGAPLLSVLIEPKKLSNLRWGGGVFLWSGHDYVRNASHHYSTVYRPKKLSYLCWGYFCGRDTFLRETRHITIVLYRGPKTFKSSLGGIFMVGTRFCAKRVTSL